MSGPKVHRYRVTAAEEKRRREDNACRAKCESLVSRCRSEARKLESPQSVDIPSLESDTHEGLIAWESALDKALKAILLQLDKENAVRVVRRLQERAPELDVSSVTLGGRPMPQKQSTAKQSSFIEREVAALVPQLGRLRDKKKMADLLDAIESLVGYGDEALAKGDLMTLKSRLNSLLTQQSINDIAEMELTRIAHINNAEAEELRQEAKTVVTKEGLDVVKRRITELLEADQARQDEEFVAKALEEVLSDLGFEASGGFEVTDFGKVAIAQSPDYPGYALRLQVNPKNGMLYTRMVALEAHDADDDANVEQMSCASIKLLRSRLGKLGVEAELASERPPGERPVEVLDGSAVAAQVNRKRRTSAGRVMSNAR